MLRGLIGSPVDSYLMRGVPNYIESTAPKNVVVGDYNRFRRRSDGVPTAFQRRSNGLPTILRREGPPTGAVLWLD